MIYIINFVEFQETDVSFSSNTNDKPDSIKFETTVPLIEIVSDKLGQWFLFAWK